MLFKFRSQQVEITNKSIFLSNLPEQFIGYRILQVSDFHLGTWLDSQDMLEIVDLINLQDPDLIAITGDFISFNVSKYAPEIARTLSGLNSKDGVIAVLGNHDHYTDAGLVRDALQQSNIIEII